MCHLQQKYSIFYKSLIENVPVRGEGERCMSAEGSSVKGSSEQSSTSFPKVKGGDPLFSGPDPLITGGLVNDTTPVHLIYSWLIILPKEIYVECLCT